MSHCIIGVTVNIATITDKHNESRFQPKKLRKVPFLRMRAHIRRDSLLIRGHSADYGKLPIGYTH